MSDNMLFHQISPSDVQPGDHLYRWRYFKMFQGIAIQRNDGIASTLFVLIPNGSTCFRLVSLKDFQGRGVLRRVLYNQGTSYLHPIKLSGTSYLDQKQPAEEVVRNALLLLEKTNLNSECMKRLLSPGPDNFARLCCTMSHEQWRAHLQANEQTSSRTNSVTENSIPVTPILDHQPFQLEEPEEKSCCPVCFDRPPNVAFGCGHIICSQCALALIQCHICRQEIRQRIALFWP